MKITPLTEENINYVMDNLDELHRKEIDVFGTTIEKAKEGFISMIGQPFTAAFYDDSLVCCLIFALERKGPSLWTVHMVTTEGIKGIGFSLTRFFKEFSDNLIAHGDDIEILSAFSNGKTLDWFNSMGFEYQGTDGNISRYLKKAR